MRQRIHVITPPSQREKLEHQSLPPNFAIWSKPVSPKRLLAAPPTTLPDTYDTRKLKDPITRKSLIMGPLDQKQCGSCYVFSSTQCLRNRLALAGQNAAVPTPSQQSALDCSINGDSLLGCSSGGQTEAMLDWLSHYWIPNNSPPYQYKGTDSVCIGVPPQQGGFKGDGVYTISDSQPSSSNDPIVTSIKQDILHYGPVVASYLVYVDFLDYWQKGSSSDVYSYDGTSDLDGGHAVLIIGWGSKPSPYWLVMNSWGYGGPSGDGTFKIAIATSGTGIDSNVVALYVSNAVDVYAKNAWPWQSTEAPPGKRPDTPVDTRGMLLFLGILTGVTLLLFLYFWWY